MNSGEEDDVGALIYREIQLRKAEAAAAAAASKKTSSSASVRRASTPKRSPTKRKRSPANNEVENPLPGGDDLEGIKRESSSEDDRPMKKVARNRIKYECSADGCTNHVAKRGYALGTGQSTNDATVKDVTIKPSKEEYASKKRKMKRA